MDLVGCYFYFYFFLIRTMLTTHLSTPVLVLMYTIYTCTCADIYYTEYVLVTLVYCVTCNIFITHLRKPELVPMYTIVSMYFVLNSVTFTRYLQPVYVHLNL